MLSSKCILRIVGEEKKTNVGLLARQVGTSAEKIEKILSDLSDCDLVEYDQETGEVKLSQWLSSINDKAENLEFATGAIILPKNRQIEIQGVNIGNFTDIDLELILSVTGSVKEIALRKIS